MFNKKAQLMMGPRKWISLILGFLLTVLGVLPMLNQYGVISFNLPAIPGIVLWILFVAGGVWLLVDATSEGTLQGYIMWPSVVIGVIVIGLGIVPLLGASGLGIIGFSLPSIAKLISDVITVLAGFLLIGGGTFGGF
jgi:hypothetical protein